MKGRGRLANNRQDTGVGDLADAVVVVPSKIQPYRKALYVFVFILGGLGLTLVSTGVLCHINPDEVLVPSWLFNLFILIGGVVIGLCILASRGATVAKKTIETGSINWWIYVFLLIMTLLLLGELYIITVSILHTSEIEQKEVQTVTSSTFDFLEDALLTELKNREAFWWEWQKSWQCCGWQNQTIPAPLATGKFCTTDDETTAPSCAKTFIDFINENVIVVSSVAGVFLLTEIAIWYSACQLGCCIKAQEPVYSSRKR